MDFAQKKKSYPLLISMQYSIFNIGMEWSTQVK